MTNKLTHISLFHRKVEIQVNPESGDLEVTQDGQIIAKFLLILVWDMLKNCLSQMKVPTQFHQDISKAWERRINEAKAACVHTQIITNEEEDCYDETV